MTNKSKEDVNGTGYEWEYAKKIDNRTTTQKILNFIYDPQTHAFMGRTAKSWGGILLFYAIFYSILALLFAICMKVLLSTLNDSYPKWQLDESLLGSNPGLGFRPQTEDPETASVIWFNNTDQNNIDTWIKLLDDFFKAEYMKNTSKAVNCTYGTKLKNDEFCRVPLDIFGKCSKIHGYGYAIGKPCVFIKLNRIYRWVPEYYKDKLDTPTNMPQNLQDKMDLLPEEQRKNVWVSCEGQSPHDKENIGPITYYPSIQGFPSYYYPYLHVPDYMSPLVAVQFEGLRRQFDFDYWQKYYNGGKYSRS
ncbi:sodium/potassium-transporting ATPase subunit beta-1-like isoform X2 [Planococcus citri]|uniref:sodium/potassium-transporting ATPase subunit beta-1-like isoform X2 n=1 Tax=Planococcus citri TaxID=170843 RepID=UPI0031F90E47